MGHVWQLRHHADRSQNGKRKALEAGGPSSSQAVRFRKTPKVRREDLLSGGESDDASRLGTARLGKAQVGRGPASPTSGAKAAHLGPVECPSTSVVDENLAGRLQVRNRKGDQKRA